MSLSLPLQDVDLIYWYAINAVPLVVAIMFVAGTIGLKREELGFTIRALHLQVLVASSGLLFGVVEYFILRPEPLIEDLTLASVLFPAVILLVGTGLVEELAFRGVIQSAAVASLGKGALLYVAAIFAVMHVGCVGCGLRLLYRPLLRVGRSEDSISSGGDALPWLSQYYPLLMATLYVDRHAMRTYTQSRLKTPRR